MPMPAFITRSVNRRSPAETFAYMTTLGNWPTFRGFGPLPGIRAASTPDGTLAVGTRVRVENTDNTVHHECITGFEPGRRYAVSMELVSPAAFLLARIDEEVILSDTPQGTEVWRRFEMVPRGFWAWPLVALIASCLLRPAVQRHDRVVAEALNAQG